MITTLETIYEHRQCGWGKLTRGLKRETGPVSLLQILDICGVKDAYWSLCCWPRALCADLRAAVAESVYEIWHAEYPDDQRVRVCIDGWRALGAGEITDDEFEKLRHGAHDASEAALCDSAAAATYSAYSAAAAFFSAYSAAAAAAAYSGYYGVAALAAQWEINERIMRAFLR